MWRQRKKYTGPKHPWKKSRIEEEHKLAEEYGIRRMRELWKARSILKNWQRLAKEIVTFTGDKKEAAQITLLRKIQKYGLLSENANLDDVLSLTLKNILDRRLESVIYKRGMALTPKQARQFIVHGKVLVNGKKMNSPSYLVKVGDEIAFVPGFTPKLKSSEKPENKVKAETQNATQTAQTIQTEVKNG
jgi:small subunit ribosomal protein S4